jgi:hypothetical protein
LTLKNALSLFIQDVDGNNTLDPVILFDGTADGDVDGAVGRQPTTIVVGAIE